MAEIRDIQLVTRPLTNHNKQSFQAIVEMTSKEIFILDEAQCRRYLTPDHFIDFYKRA